jgi:hypothetical protein
MSNWICWYVWKHEPEIKPCGSICLWPSLGCCGMIWCDNVNLALSHSMRKISDDFFWENKTWHVPQRSNHLPKPFVAIKVQTSYIWLLVKLLWPLVESFHAPMIEITYTPHIYVNSHTECYTMLTVKFRQPSHEFTFGVGITFIPYPLVLTPMV